MTDIVDSASSKAVALYEIEASSSEEAMGFFSPVLRK